MTICKPYSLVDLRYTVLLLLHPFQWHVRMLEMASSHSILLWSGLVWFHFGSFHIVRYVFWFLILSFPLSGDIKCWWTRLHLHNCELRNITKKRRKYYVFQKTKKAIKVNVPECRFWFGISVGWCWILLSSFLFFLFPSFSTRSKLRVLLLHSAWNSPFVFAMRLRFVFRPNLPFRWIPGIFVLFSFLFFHALFDAIFSMVIHWNYIFHTCAFLSYIRYYVSRWCFFFLSSCCCCCCRCSWKNACVICAVYTFALVTHVMHQTRWHCIVELNTRSFLLIFFFFHFFSATLRFTWYTLLFAVHNIKDSRQIATVASAQRLYTQST